MLKKEFSVIRQSSNPANRHSGRQAFWQDGRSISWLKYLVFFLFLIMSFEEIAQSSIIEEIYQGATTHESCTEDCGRANPVGATADDVLDVLGWEPAPGFVPVEDECPESVKSIREVMALTYGTCEALKPFSWGLVKNSDGEYLIDYNGTFLKGYGSLKDCSYDSEVRESCNYISNYNDLKKTHPYNQMDKTNECKAQMQCGSQPCLATFTKTAESYAYFSSNREGNDINIFKDTTMSKPLPPQGNTPKFLGWNCSEYVTTAMALAGQRLVKPGDDNCAGNKGGNLGEHVQWFSAAKYSQLASADQQSCSCLNEVDITDTNASIESGDIITLSVGHVMIVESVEQPVFREPTKKEDCDEKNIRFDQLQIRVNHSSRTTAGPASLQFSEYLSLNHGQSITYGMRKYIDECKAAGGLEADCWTEEDKNEFSNYIFSAKKIGLAEVPTGDKWDVENGKYIEDPMWPKMRAYLSNICKKRWNRNNPTNIIPNAGPDNEFLKVIRHKDEKDEPDCTTPEGERPKLKHKECLGDCINQEENQCPTYGVE